MKHLLLVDDEPLIRLSIRNLEDWQAHDIEFSYEASNGREVLEIMARHNDIDAVIADVDMPLMDGLDMAEAMRSQGYKTPVLFLSSFDTFDFARRAFKAGAVDYILKKRMERGPSAQHSEFGFLRQRRNILTMRRPISGLVGRINGTYFGA